MAFSESFEIGNSTLKHIEGAFEICKITQDERLKTQNDEDFETIDESPTCKINKTKSGFRTQKSSQKRVSRKKNYKRNLSMLNESFNSEIFNQDVLSDFFKSDINFKENDNEIFEKYNKKEHRTKNFKNSSNVDLKKVCFDKEEIGSMNKIVDVAQIQLNLETDLNKFENDVDIFHSFKYDLSTKNKSFSSFKLDEQSFDFNVMNITENPSFICVNNEYEENKKFLTQELQKSKKDLYLLEDEVFLNLTSKLENLSTSEKPLLHFSISSEESLLNDETKENNTRILNTKDKELNEPMSKSQTLKINNNFEAQISEQNVLSSSIKNTIIIEDLNNSDNFKDLDCQSNISKWNLPEAILKEYKKKGIITLFDWQVKCLSNHKVLLENKNLVYSAPTSAGKTLVSEILTIKNIVERKKKVIYILPFVSVVREKMIYLQDLFSSSGYRVEGFFGGYTPPGGFDSINLAICTIEKANSIINRLLEQKKLENLGCIIIDEIHLISDPGRGYILELLLTKILYMTKKLSHKIQIVTMSATLPNCELLTDWLNAELYITDFRPVELKEMIKIGKKIYNKKFNLIREIDPLLIKEIENDQDEVAFLCIETLLEACSVIIFCPSKDWCENLCQNLSKIIKNLYNSDNKIGLKLRNIMKKEKLAEMKEHLNKLTTGCDKILKITCEYGCAFHHAGLTTEERDVVESAFKSGLIKIIVATSTLSSGVNLPARRVIIRSPLFGGKSMDSLTYKQMIGRAGRTGKDTLGESILICNENNSRIGKDLVSADLKAVSSCLGYDSGIHLKRALLEVISSGVVKTHSDIETFLSCTLYSISNRINKDNNVLKNKNDEICSIEYCINFLMEYEFIREQKTDEEKEVCYIPSRLGMACLASSLPPTDGIILFSELQKSRKCFVLESELHAVYLVTPYSVCYQLHNVDWLHYLDIWERLSPGMKKVAEIVGVKESFLVRAMRSQNNLDYKLLQIHKRFYTALALQELVNEVPIGVVSVKYKCNRGLLQSLQQISSTFASIVTSFCNALNWKILALIVSQFKERLYFGVHHDLIDLMRLTDMNSQKARALFNAGIQTLVDLANSNILTVEKILYDSLSFESTKKQEGENEYDAVKRNALRTVYVTGKLDLSFKEAAQILIHNARTFLQYEIGVKCDWKNNENFNETTYSKLNDILEKSTQKNNIDQEAQNKSHNDSIVDKEIEKNKHEAKLLNSNPNKNIELNTSTTRNDSSPFTNFLTNNFANRATRQQNVNKSLDEINYSQNVTTSNRKQKLPKHERKVSSKIDKENIKQNNAEESSIQISDVSNESIIKNPNSLNNLTKNPNINLTCNEKKLNNICIHDISEEFSSYQNYYDKIINKKEVGFSIGIESLPLSLVPKPIIGDNLFSNENNKNKITDLKYFTIDNKYFITGVSFSFEENSSLYLNLQNVEEHHDTHNLLKHKLQFLKKLFSLKELTLRIYDSKAQIKILEKIILKNLEFKNQIEDPKIANWLLHPDIDVNFAKMISKYAPKYLAVLEDINYKGYQGLGLNHNCELSGRKRSSYEACIINNVVKSQLEKLESFAEGQMKKFFHELEMPIQKALANSEVVGISISTERMQELSETMFQTMKKLETKIFLLHGSRFNLGSTSAVARVLGLHRKANGKLSTSKQILERIDSPISNLILNYRKVNTVLTKNILPLQKIIENNRIHGNSITISSTGRISMYEPNIQNVAKDFYIPIDENNVKISCRSAFLCSTGRFLLSADFCQLEMRILTHLSQDKSLKNAIDFDKDIFTAIAAKWNKIPEEIVSEKLRNGTKQICYGIIYGMGIKSLSENLKCTEQEAISMSEQFHTTYPGIRAYIQKVVKFARQNGYIETITGRRRYLEYINSSDPSLRNQAERQSVNSAIQGSAADIAKSAILRMEKNVIKYKEKLGVNITNSIESQVQLVLHLHDELIYETPEDKVRNVAKVLKATMENCVKLSVPLRVKLKVGKSWGEMVNINV